MAKKCYISAMQIRSDVNLQSHHTFALRVKSQYFVTLDSEAECLALLSHPLWSTVPHYVLGEGSNTLFTGDFPGLIVNIKIPGIHIIKESVDQIWLDVGAGVVWQELVNYSLQQGYCGIENLSLIPGTIGAAPIQNIGAYGAEIKDVFEHLTALDTETRQFKTFTLSECEFDYRDSVFKNRLKNRVIITRVCLRLAKNPHFNTSYPALADAVKHIPILSTRLISEAVCEIRRQKLPDPAKIPNAGSFFKNPTLEIAEFNALQQHYPMIPHFVIPGKIKVPAAWLIEQCGWKGKRIGDAGTHATQPLVLVNHGNATGAEILAIARQIQSDVLEKFQIDLTPEVNIV